MEEEIISEIEQQDMDYLFRLTMQKKWSEVAEIYKNHSWAHSAILTKSKETALHMAVSSYSEENINSCADAIKKMIDCIPEGEASDILSMQNNKGDTPLHLGAAVGWEDICGFMASKEPHLIYIRNVESETPLFVAARYGNLETYLCLHHIYAMGTLRVDALEWADHSLCRRKDGNTVLHLAISREYFGLAYQIMRKFPLLISCINEEGESPLHVLAKNPSVFRSSDQLRFPDSIIYKFVIVDGELKEQPYVPKYYAQNSSSSLRRGTDYPVNDHTCVTILRPVWFPIYRCLTAGRSSFLTSAGQPTDEEKHPNIGQRNELRMDKEEHHRFYLPNCTTCVLLLQIPWKVILIVMGIGYSGMREIFKKKQRQLEAKQILDLLIAHEGGYKYKNDGKEPPERWCSEHIELPASEPLPNNVDSNWVKKYMSDEAQHKKEQNETKSVRRETPLLMAAERGNFEIVEKILDTVPVAIQDVDSDGKNVLMVAAENRRFRVFDYLLSLELPDYMFLQVDNQGNSVLHLAARMAQFQSWRTLCATLLMQREFIWYEFVKCSIPPECGQLENKEGDTPWQIFSTTHETLLKDSTQWLIKTSESYTVVAALIATVAFATSAAVPGGLNEDTGYPNMLAHGEFHIFSISSLIALCLSVTSLLFFLGIITSREFRFKSNLPRKLLVGLTSLFGSIIATLVSFCAGHSFILGEKLGRGTLAIYAIACAAVLVFAVANLPLFFALNINLISITMIVNKSL